MDNLIRVPAPFVQRRNEQGEIVDVKQPCVPTSGWYWVLSLYDPPMGAANRVIVSPKYKQQIPEKSE